MMPLSPESNLDQWSAECVMGWHKLKRKANLTRVHGTWWMDGENATAKVGGKGTGVYDVIWSPSTNHDQALQVANKVVEIKGERSFIMAMQTQISGNLAVPHPHDLWLLFTASPTAILSACKIVMEGK